MEKYEVSVERTSAPYLALHARLVNAKTNKDWPAGKLTWIKPRYFNFHLLLLPSPITIILPSSGSTVLKRSDLKLSLNKSSWRFTKKQNPYWHNQIYSHNLQDPNPICLEKKDGDEKKPIGRSVTPWSKKNVCQHCQNFKRRLSFLLSNSEVSSLLLKLQPFRVVKYSLPFYCIWLTDKRPKKGCEEFSDFPL